MGQAVNVTTESGSKMNFKSLGQNAEGATQLQYVYTEMSQVASSPMGEGETDFSTLIGKEFSFDLGVKGDCENLGGFDDFEPISNALGEQVEWHLQHFGLVI